MSVSSLFLIQFNINDSLDYILRSGILSLISIIVAITVFFYQQYRDRKARKLEFHDRLIRTCNLLLVDMIEWEKWLSDEKYEAQLIRHNNSAYTENVLSIDNYQCS